MVSAVLIKINDHSRYTYGFNPSVSFLLFLVSDIDQDVIKKVTVYQRHFPRYIPWYNAARGGGAITLGTNQKQSISFTENFFEEENLSDPDHFILKWLRLASHEIMHIHHAVKYKYLLVYLWVFIVQYIRFGHRHAPAEKEANMGTVRFDRFNNFISVHYGANSLCRLLRSNMNHSEKIDRITNWWLRYKKEAILE